MNVEVRPIKTAAETALATNFAMAKRALPGAPAVAALREDAFQRFESEGLPHRRIEDWKYTDLRALMRDAKPLASPPDAQAKARGKTAGAIVSGVQGHRIVFVDGTYVAELSDQALEAGVTITSLAAGLARGDSVDSLFAENAGASISDPALELNTAFMADGALVHVARGATVAKPIHLVFVHGGGPATAAFMRSQVVVEE